MREWQGQPLVGLYPPSEPPDPWLRCPDVSAPEPPEVRPELFEGPPGEAVARMTISAPAERNPKLARFIESADADLQLKAWWYAAQAMADRLGMSDHSWVHVRIVLNIALRLYRLLRQRDVEPAMAQSMNARLRTQGGVQQTNPPVQAVPYGMPQAQYAAPSGAPVQPRRWPPAGSPRQPAPQRPGRSRGCRRAPACRAVTGRS